MEVTRSKVRRERMGHIELAAPVSHIWYFKGIPSRMGLVLDMSPRAGRNHLFCFICSHRTRKYEFREKQLLTEREYREKREQYGQEFQAAMGAEAIKQLLDNVDLDAEAAELKEELKSAQGQNVHVQSAVWIF